VGRSRELLKKEGSVFTAGKKRPGANDHPMYARKKRGGMVGTAHPRGRQGGGEKGGNSIGQASLRHRASIVICQGGAT